VIAMMMRAKGRDPGRDRGNNGLIKQFTIDMFWAILRQLWAGVLIKRSDPILSAHRNRMVAGSDNGPYFSAVYAPAQGAIQSLFPQTTGETSARHTANRTIRGYLGRPIR
jgi:hypothetical protein